MFFHQLRILIDLKQIFKVVELFELYPWTIEIISTLFCAQWNKNELDMTDSEIMFLSITMQKLLKTAKSRLQTFVRQCQRLKQNYCPSINVYSKQEQMYFMQIWYVTSLQTVTMQNINTFAKKSTKQFLSSYFKIYCPYVM